MSKPNKKKSIADEIADLYSTAPQQEQDPDDIAHTDSLRKPLYSSDDDDFESEMAPQSSRLRLRAPIETDESLAGKVVSRKELKKAQLNLDSDEDLSESEEEGSGGETEEEEEVDDEFRGRPARANGTVADDQLQKELEEAEEEERKMLGRFGRNQESEQEKGAHTRNQKAVLDAALEFRIRAQKPLLLANRLPPRSVIARFPEKRIAAALDAASADLGLLVSDICSLREKLGAQNADMPKIKAPKVDKASSANGEELWDGLEKMTAQFRPWRNATIDKWNTRTQMATGALGAKKFKALNQSIVSQIDHVMADGERQVERTQRRRVPATVLGVKRPSTELEEDIYDDCDFYELLLRDLIASVSQSGVEDDDAVALSRRAIELKRLKAKARKKVDTKASKGRKLRFEVQPKLVSFMFPKGEIIDVVSAELFRNMFADV